LGGSTVQAQIIRDFTATVDGNRAILQWSSVSEAGVLLYRVQRSFDGTNFHDVANIDPRGDRQDYRYVDDDLFKGQMRTYYYRLEIVMSDGERFYSPVVEVVFDSSNIKRTWGSIKALFR